MFSFFSDLQIINEVTYESLFHVLQKGKTAVPSGTAPPSHQGVSLAEGSKPSLVQSKDPEKRAVGRVDSPPPAPASGNLSVQRKTSSESPPTSGKVTLPAARNTKQSQASLRSERSEIKSLDELFSKAADGEDSISSSSCGAFSKIPSR